MATSSRRAGPSSTSTGAESIGCPWAPTRQAFRDALVALATRKSRPALATKVRFGLASWIGTGAPGLPVKATGATNAPFAFHPLHANKNDSPLVVTAGYVPAELGPGPK